MHDLKRYWKERYDDFWYLLFFSDCAFAYKWRFQLGPNKFAAQRNIRYRYRTSGGRDSSACIDLGLGS